MFHFTSKAWLVTSSIPGRTGNYGSTVSVVGIFNTLKRAEIGKADFIRNYRPELRGLSNHVSLKEIVPGVVCEIIIADIYE